MLNAHKAYKIATVAAKDNVQRYFKFIMRKIEAAASNGQYSCSFYGPLQDELVKMLTDLGYEVNKTTYTIEWRNV